MDLACDKDATKRLLDDAGVPVPRGEEVQTLRGALEVANDVGYPVVIKPVDGNHGRGATIGVRDDDHVEKAFETAKEHSRYVMVERQLIGEDFRALVIDQPVRCRGPSSARPRRRRWQALDRGAHRHHERGTRGAASVTRKC